MKFDLILFYFFFLFIYVGNNRMLNFIVLSFLFGAQIRVKYIWIFQFSNNNETEILIVYRNENIYSGELSFFRFKPLLCIMFS